MRDRYSVQTQNMFSSRTASAGVRADASELTVVA